MGGRVIITGSFSRRRMMIKQEAIDVLEEYRRPASPLYDHHFQRLPSEIIWKENVPVLLEVLMDTSLAAVVRENAAGALGEIGDHDAVGPLISALEEPGIRRGAAIALGRMKAKEATAALKALAPRVKAARWALSQLGVSETVDGVIDDLRSGQLRLITQKLRSLPSHLRKKVEEEIVQQFREALARGEGQEDLRWYVTALSSFRHPDAAALLAGTLESSWKRMGSLVGLQTERTCCGCLHNRTLRALKTNPSMEAVPNLVETVTNRYQRHALMALKRLRELEGGGLPDKQIARMIDKNAALQDPIGSETQRAQTLKQLVRFAGDYGGTECRRALRKLRNQFPPSQVARAIEAAIQTMDARLQ